MYPLNNHHKSGEGLRYLSADEINTIANMLNGLRIDVDEDLDHAEVIPPNQDGTGWRFRIPKPGFSFRIWVGGKPMTIPTQTTNYLSIPLDGETTCSWVKAMPSIMPSNAEVIDVTRTFGDLHFPANVGGR